MKVNSYIGDKMSVKLNTVYPYSNIKHLYTQVKNKAVYIHPAGECVTTLSTQEGLVYQKAFGGACLTYNEQTNVDTRNDNNNNVNGIADFESASKITVSTVFTDDGFEFLLSDDLSSRYGYTLNSYGGFVRNQKNEAHDAHIARDLIPIKRKSMSDMYKHFLELPTSRLDIGDLHTMDVRKHLDLYEAQENALQQLQAQEDGFHLLSGEVGVGKTHIAAKYINDYMEKNPDARILIIEPIDGVVNRFRDLIDVDSYLYDYNMPHSGGYVTITDKTSALEYQKWDMVVFDEFHKMDKDVNVSRYPLDASDSNMAKNVLAMTGTVSNTYPEQIWSSAKNYVSRYAKMNGLPENEALLLAPYNVNGFPQMTAIRTIPEFFLEHVVGDKSVTLLRQDIKELGLEEKMPVNKFSAGIELSGIDKSFYNFMKMRADTLGMTQADQLRILDMAFNTNQKEFIVQPTRVYGKSDKSFRLVDINEVDTTKHDLLYLGRHDQPFVDKKIDFISNLHHDKQEKILVYLTNDGYGERVKADLDAKGILSEFVDTHENGAVDKINNSVADVVIFDINPIKEGVDLHANHVVWYSTPESSGLDEQACGRITRLSSEQTEKNFYYLYHKTTIQQELTRNIIRTNDVNNLALKRTDIKTEELDFSL